MEAKELMIGDWVIVNSKPTKVEEVDGGSINTTYSYGEIEDYIDEDEISPIPLTAEMLEKNGFTEIGEGFELPSKYLAKSRFFIFKNTKALYILVGGDWASLNYVHELQHALRLCGLNDLADNFVV